MYDAIKLNNGDIEFDLLGRIKFINGKDALIQSINNKFQTFEGDLFYDEMFGISKELLKIKRKEENIPQIESYLKYAFSDDARITDITVDNLVVDENLNIKIYITFYLYDSSILEFQF